MSNRDKHSAHGKAQESTPKYSCRRLSRRTKLADVERTRRGIFPCPDEEAKGPHSRNRSGCRDQPIYGQPS